VVVRSKGRRVGRGEEAEAGHLAMEIVVHLALFVSVVSAIICSR
jgi:hypothetical protein